MLVRSSGLSDVGLTRTHNEDCFEIEPEHGVYLVADGMGGHSFGEVASRIAVTTVKQFVVDVATDSAKLKESSHPLKQGIEVAHDKVLEAIEQDESLYGMGTTLVGMVANDSFGVVAHVGDSRAYVYRGGDLELLTQDHTWVNEQVSAGHMSEEQARLHPLKNVVTRALGGEASVEVDVSELELRPGDLYLLCSDGLTTMLTDADISAVMAEHLPLEEACRKLVNESNDRGGLDNITVILVSIEEDSNDI